MILEFLDGSQIDVKNIFGGPRLILGVMRDTLRIEVSPDTCSFEDLKVHFKDNPKTESLYTYENVENAKGKMVSKKIEVGKGYQIFVSITDEVREIPSEPGKMGPINVEEVYVVTIAQLTYPEYVAEGMEKPPKNTKT